MQDVVFKCSVSVASEGVRDQGTLVLDFRTGAGSSGGFNTVADRLTRAARWAMGMDLHYRELVRAGRSPHVFVPAVPSSRRGRVQAETATDYRKLQLGIGELIRPLLLDPPDLTALYPFQQKGVAWLNERNNCILADDMGLGKTVQVISAMRVLFNRGEIRTVLVVCPKSLLSTWEREVARWAPELGVVVVAPPARIREEAWKALVGHCHVLLTNYEQLRHPPEALRAIVPDLIVADEAHRLRNRTARVTSEFFQLEPSRFWALTGTPLERDLEDLATLLTLVVPKKFGLADAKRHPTSLRSRARSYVLRRRKQDVLEELPPVLDTTEVLDLSEPQRRAYRATIELYRRYKKKGDELALLTRLQAVCDLDTESRRSCKIDRIVDLLDRIRERREKAVVFSYRLEPLRELRRRTIEKWGEAATALLVGEMDHKERERAVSHFRNDQGTVALLASSRIAGEGLTLVEANHVFLLNQWWNPTANDQARDRVVRIGQRRKVRVYRFCCRGTIEESLERILSAKRELFDDAVGRLSQSEDAVWLKMLREVGIDHLLEDEVH